MRNFIPPSKEYAEQYIKLMNESDSKTQAFLVSEVGNDDTIVMCLPLSAIRLMATRANLPINTTQAYNNVYLCKQFLHKYDEQQLYNTGVYIHATNKLVDVLAQGKQ